MPNGELETLLQRGREAWPRIELDLAAFEQHVRRLEARGASPRAEHAADLYLACACAANVAGAVDAFEATFADKVSRAIGAVDASPEFIEEVLQLLRIKLFVKAPPKIADYGGRAKLSTWLATAASRTALNLRESRWGRAHAALDDEPLAVPCDLDVRYVRERYREHFQLAVSIAVGRLSSKERTLLRLHLGERLGIDRLAVVYGVGRSTVARWLAAARATLLDEARREAQARLGISPSELLEVGADLRSVIDVSLMRLLASRDS
jgi:RNA polymerase sigma-70 factor (ECF subfamily)